MKDYKKNYKVTNAKPVSDEILYNILIGPYFRLSDKTWNSLTKRQKVAYKRQTRLGFTLQLLLIASAFGLGLHCQSNNNNSKDNIEIISDDKYNEDVEPSIEELNQNGLIDDYNEYLNRVADFLSNNSNNNYEFYTNYYNMLHDGQLSIGDTFEYEGNIIDYDEEMGLDVVAGGGVCRNISANLKDVFDAAGIENGQILTYSPKVNTDPDIPNHVINWFECNGDIIVCDPTCSGSDVSRSLLIDYNDDNAFVRPSGKVTYPNWSMSSVLSYIDEPATKKYILNNMANYYGVSCDNIDFNERQTFEISMLANYEDSIIDKISELNNTSITVESDEYKVLRLEKKQR